MKKVALIVFLVFGAVAFAYLKEQIKAPAAFVPPGYVVVNEVQGDLNGDNRPDYVFLIKDTDKQKVVKDTDGRERDYNRRGILVVLSKPDGYALAVDNRGCFFSEDEEWGVAGPPTLTIWVEKGKLHIDYNHGLNGDWGYTFRYRNGDFELIGYDEYFYRDAAYSEQGYTLSRSISINLLTKKAKIVENLNEDPESEEDNLRETWKKFALRRPITLQDIANFDEFEPGVLLGLRK
ncbi:MAG: hypothetical protein WHV61_10775 [Burkholderiales bacterium]